MACVYPSKSSAITATTFSFSSDRLPSRAKEAVYSLLPHFFSPNLVFTVYTSEALLLAGMGLGYTAMLRAGSSLTTSTLTGFLERFAMEVASLRDLPWNMLPSSKVVSRVPSTPPIVLVYISLSDIFLSYTTPLMCSITGRFTPDM